MAVGPLRVNGCKVPNPRLRNTGSRHQFGCHRYMHEAANYLSETITQTCLRATCVIEADLRISARDRPRVDIAVYVCVWHLAFTSGFERPFASTLRKPYACS